MAHPAKRHDDINSSENASTSAPTFIAIDNAYIMAETDPKISKAEMSLRCFDPANPLSSVTVMLRLLVCPLCKRGIASQNMTQTNDCHD
jgi:hypothetical protein